MDFAPAAISGLHPGNDGRPPRVEVRFLGLFGPNGPLPLHLTDYARERIKHGGDATFARFADMFHHRILLLVLSRLGAGAADGQPRSAEGRPVRRIHRVADRNRKRPVARARRRSRSREAVLLGAAGSPDSQRGRTAGVAARLLPPVDSRRAVRRTLDEAACRRAHACRRPRPQRVSLESAPFSARASGTASTRFASGSARSAWRGTSRSCRAGRQSRR